MRTLKPTPLRIPQKIEKDPELIGFFRDLTSSLYQVFFAQSQFSASDTQDITTAGGVTYHNRITRVQGDGGPITVTATPSVKPLSDGKEIIIQGDDDTNTVTLQDESNLASSGLALAGGANMVLGKGDTLHLLYDAGDAKFYEISRSNN